MLKSNNGSAMQLSSHLVRVLCQGSDLNISRSAEKTKSMQFWLIWRKFRMMVQQSGLLSAGMVQERVFSLNLSRTLLLKKNLSWHRRISVLKDGCIRQRIRPGRSIRN